MVARGNSADQPKLNIPMRMLCSIMAASLQRRIVDFMSDAGRPVTTSEIVRHIGMKTKKEANPTIYGMERQGVIKRTQMSPPTWQLSGSSAMEPTDTYQSQPQASKSPINPFSGGGEAFPGSGDLPSRVLQLLRDRDTPMQTIHISKALGLVTSKDINPTLYDLQRRKAITRVQISPAVWKLSDGGMSNMPTGPPAKRPRTSSLEQEELAQSPAYKQPRPLVQQPVAASSTIQSINALEKNAISAINEFAQKSRLKIEIKHSDSGPPHNKTFTCTLQIAGRSFSAKAGTKKGARLRASELACQAFLYQPAAEAFPSQVAVNADLSHGDLMASVSHAKLNVLLQTLEHGADLVGRKVMAAFIMTSLDSEPVVVSLGTGNRCVGGNLLSLTGTTVNDCHAEIIARRGLKQFLFREINAYSKRQDSQVFERSGQVNLLSVKPGVEFHLYISTAPCGDGALFCHSDTSQDVVLDDSQHQPKFENKGSGHLRTKVEDGEGTIPIPEDLQMTWDGLQRGERLRTMSCSDKIARWNFLGLQGALLSQFVETIYLSSITIGALYKHGHLSRAVCCRISDLDSVSPHYEVNHPRLSTVSETDKLTRSTQKMSNSSMNWYLGVKEVEILDGRKGKLPNGSTSRISKSSLFRTYAAAANVVGMRVPETYREAKMKATEYQTAKESLYEYLADEGYGNWVQKPAEQEQFSKQPAC
jgi:double-stranded RNA-specific adenosine deaminase